MTKTEQHSRGTFAEPFCSFLMKVTVTVKYTLLAGRVMSYVLATVVKKLMLRAYYIDGNGVTNAAR